MPELVLPTVAVRTSYLEGEAESALAEGTSMDGLADATADFDGYVAQRSVVRQMWAVPVTELWYIDDDAYIGTIVIRHRLTPALVRAGGQIGYHVVPGHRRRGHATAMLAAVRPVCRDLGLAELLITCGADNIGSRRVIEANGGVLRDTLDGEVRFWLQTSSSGSQIDRCSSGTRSFRPDVEARPPG